MNALTRLALAGLLALPLTAVLAQSGPANPEQAMNHREKQLNLLDTDHDGRLSRTEVQARGGLSHAFDEIDTNRDGYLDREELRQWASTHEVKHGRGGKHQGKSFGRYDTNRDGVITADEAAKMPNGAQLFQQADANGDGKVTKQEAHALRKTQRAASAPQEPARPASTGQ